MSFEENFEKMLTEKKDISEFAIDIKKMLDQVGSILEKEALKMLVTLVEDDSRLNRIGMFTRNQRPIPQQPYSEKFIIIELTTSTKWKVNIGIYRMIW